MCTAIANDKGNFYFGRTLDLEYHYNEAVVISPRTFRYEAPTGESFCGNYALIGMATVEAGVPLYYDAMNEYGLCMAGLHFPENAVYLPPMADRQNIPSYALIPRVLSACATLEEAKLYLSRIRLTDESFNEKYKPTPLHWMIAQKGQSIVVEPTVKGLQIYDNPTGVLTNNPDFPAQLAGVSRYIGLSPKEPCECLMNATQLPPASRGLGAFGMPGDFSSPSRFIRALFVKQNTPSFHGSAAVMQFFRQMSVVSIPKGAVEAADGRIVYTIYTSCCDPAEKIYYYSSYENPTVVGIRMKESELRGDTLQCFPLRIKGTVCLEN